jgi:hypothetical protein
MRLELDRAPEAVDCVRPAGGQEKGGGGGGTKL